MIKFKYFTEQTNEDDGYKITETAGHSANQPKEQKPKDEYKTLETSGLSGGQPKPKKSKSPNGFTINPIKEDQLEEKILDKIRANRNITKPKYDVKKHPATHPDALFSSMEHYKEKEKLFKEHNPDSTKKAYDLEYKRQILFDQIGRHSRGYPKLENPEHRRIIENYSGSGSYGINGSLMEHAKGYIDDDELELSMGHKIKPLDEAIENHPAPRDMYVYSGLKGSISDADAKHGIIDREENKRVHKLKMPAYTSSSMHPAIAQEFAKTIISTDGKNREKHILKIKIPEGSKHGMYIGHMSSINSEHEFLLKRNKKLHVHPEPEKLSNEDHDGHTIHHYIWHGHIVEDEDSK